MFHRREKFKVILIIYNTVIISTACVLPKERRNGCLGMGAWSWGKQMGWSYLAGLSIERKGPKNFHSFIFLWLKCTEDQREFC